MVASTRWFWSGGDAALRAAIAAKLGGPEVGDDLAQAKKGDLLVLSAAHAPHGSAAGHAFAALRAAKDAGLRVFLVVTDGDKVGTQLGRFCLADGVLTWAADRGVLGGDELVPNATPRRVAVDALLGKLEPLLRTERGETSLQRMLRFEREDSLLHRLQDPETGLFDGPYATLKLDEEWKRSHRFHQPLSLLLLDLGPALEHQPDAVRRSSLAEAAGVFLNECRDIDVLARFQPTVFLFLLPGTGPDGAEVLAKRILAALRTRMPKDSGLQPACGLCSVPSSDVPDRRAFLAIAEACLRRAVGTGGGVCTSWQ